MTIDTPMGIAWALTEHGVVTGFGFGADPHNGDSDPNIGRQVAEYFDGARTAFRSASGPARKHLPEQGSGAN